MTTASVIGDFLQPVITRELAQKLVALRADEATVAKLAELADKNTEGLLTHDERREYEAYVEAIDVISILQAKARRLLSE